MALLAGLLCSTATTVAAQGPPVRKVRYGVETGLTVSNFSYSHDFLQADARSRFAFSLGGAAVIPLQEYLDIRTGIRFARYGSRFDYDDGTRMRTLSVNQNYVAVPVIVRGRDAMTGRTFFGMGGEVAYLVSANAKTREDFTSGPPTETEESITSDVHSFNFSLVFSAGAEFPVNDALWFVDFRYGVGFVDTADEDAFGLTWKTRAIEVLVGGLW